MVCYGAERRAFDEASILSLSREIDRTEACAGCGSAGLERFRSVGSQEPDAGLGQCAQAVVVETEAGFRPVYEFCATGIFDGTATPRDYALRSVVEIYELRFTLTAGRRGYAPRCRSCLCVPCWRLEVCARGS